MMLEAGSNLPRALPCYLVDRGVRGRFMKGSYVTPDRPDHDHVWNSALCYG